MPHRLSLFTVVFGLVALAACSAPTAPTTSLRPSFDFESCDTIWVHPDSVPDPNTYSDTEGCHVVMPWAEELRVSPDQQFSTTGGKGRR